jgi:hemolysin III
MIDQRQGADFASSLTSIRCPTGVTLRAVEDELANTLTHGVGLVLSVAGMVALAVLTSLRGNLWHIIGCGIYGGSLVMLYGASTAYHGARRPRVKRILRTVDHIAIYLLIAGTYTPFTLVNLRGPWGWTLFGLVWSLAVFGTLFKLIVRDHPEWFSLGIYLIMGWVCVIAAKPILEIAPGGLLALLLGGGAAYTLGTLFYAWDHKPYYHAVWHVFVLAGSSLHFCAIMLYVVPLGF